MRNTFGRWMGALLLCCAASAMAQSICAGVSANDDAADLVSDSARVGRSQTPDGHVIPASASQSSSYDYARVLSRKGKSKANRRAELNSHFGYSSHPQASMVGTHSIANDSKHKKMEGNNEENLSGNTDTEGSWGGLPDSTRGTGVVSPPDAGTTSPIEWNPGYSFGLPDFSNRTFLNPTLHVAANSTRRIGARKGHRAPDGFIMRSKPFHTVTSPLIETLNPSLSRGPGLHSSIPDTPGQQ